MDKEQRKTPDKRRCDINKNRTILPKTSGRSINICNKTIKMVVKTVIFLDKIVSSKDTHYLTVCNNSCVLIICAALLQMAEGISQSNLVGAMQMAFMPEGISQGNLVEAMQMAIP